MNRVRRRVLLRTTGAALGIAGAAALLPAGTRAALLESVRRPGAAPLDNPAPPGASLPRLRRLPGGDIVLSWVEPAGGNEHRLVYSTLHAGQWNPPVQVARGPHWFVNWADFPSVVPIDARFWVAHWLVRRIDAARYDYDIALAVSRDGGRSWSKPLAPYRDMTPAEHGFVSIFPAGDHAGVVWLDGREYARSPEQARADGKTGNFALRYCTVTRDGIAGKDMAIDDNVCTCCQTSAVLAAKGPVVAYRGRTAEEIRDNLSVRLVEGKWQVGPPLGPDGWRIAACPVNGPALAARGDAVVAAWFTGAGNRGRVLAAVSNDGGASFGRPVELDGRDPVGRIAAEWIDDRSAAVAWIGVPDKQGTAQLQWCRVSRDARSSGPSRIAAVSAERQSGFPQLALSGQRLLAAWTETEPHQGVRTAWVSLD